MSSSTKPGNEALNLRRIDNEFSVTGQIEPDQIKSIADAGFKSILCARPDNEEPGQPGFEAIASAAREAGLEAVHIPVSGMLGEGQIIRFEQAWNTLPRPMLGYCRSGARAGSLHGTLKR